MGEYALRHVIVHGFVRRKLGGKDNNKKAERWWASGFRNYYLFLVNVELFLMQCRIAFHDHSLLGHLFHFSQKLRIAGL